VVTCSQAHEGYLVTPGLLLLYLTCSVIQLVGTASKEPVFKRGDGQLHWAIGQFDYVLFQQMAKS
jgi:hypothetical protein